MCLGPPHVSGYCMSKPELCLRNISARNVLSTLQKLENNLCCKKTNPIKKGFSVAKYS